MRVCAYIYIYNGRAKHGHLVGRQVMAWESHSHSCMPMLCLPSAPCGCTVPAPGARIKEGEADKAAAGVGDLVCMAALLARRAPPLLAACDVLLLAAALL